MFDLEAKFNELVNRYNVIVSDEGVADGATLYNSYVNTLLKVLDSFGNEPIGIYGLGQNAEELFKLIGDENDYNIVCLIDNDTSKKDLFEEYLGHLKIPIIQSRDIERYEPKKILITHLNSRKAIKQHVKELYPDIECFDIYELIEEKGVDCGDLKQPYWDTHYHFMRYFLVKNQMVYNYKVAANLEEKESFLRKIISMHLRLRDFYTADLFIRDYIFLGFKGKERYISFSEELSEMFKSARQEMLNKSNKNILMFVPDSLNKEDVENMLYLKSLSEDRGFVFENAFSSCEWTTQSFKSIFTGKTQFEDELYSKKRLKPDDCLELKSLDEAGYRLKIFGSIQEKELFDEINLAGAHDNGDELLAINETITEVYWNFLCAYLKEDKKNFFIIYNENELHSPYINSLYKNDINPFPMFGNLYYYRPDYPLPKFTDSDVKAFNESYNRQISDCAEYTDKQMEFYFKFINFKTDTIVVMGDHGKDPKIYWEEHAKKHHKGEPVNVKPFKILNNPAFIIFDEGLKSGYSSDIFSYVDVMKLICNIISGNYDMSIYKRNYAVVDSCPIYNKYLLKMYNYLNHGDSRYGHSVVYTDNEKFVYFLNGVQKYYILPNEYNDEDNLIDDPKYKQRIEFFREIVSHVKPEEILKSGVFDSIRELLSLDDATRTDAEKFVKKIHEDELKKPSLLEYKFKIRK